MNGHQPLIAMRANGIKPRAVWIADSDSDAVRLMAGDWWRERNCSDRTWHAQIRIQDNDLPESLDLRWLSGLHVHLHSDRSPARFHRLFDACVAHGAAMVCGVVNGQTLWHRNET